MLNFHSIFFIIVLQKLYIFTVENNPYLSYSDDVKADRSSRINCEVYQALLC